MRKLVLVLSSIAAGAAAQETANTNLPPIVVTVTAAAISKYRVEQPESARVPFAAEESPQVVDVLTEDFIRDRNPTDLDNLLAFQPGVYTGGKTLLSRTAGQYTMRGLSGSQVLLNGRVPLSAGMGTFMDPALIERVELPKGPVGAVFGGQGSALGPYGAGGAIAVYQKRAKAGEAFGSAEVRTSFTEDGGMRYRFLGDMNEAIVGDSVWLRLPVGVDFNKPFWLPKGYAWGRSLTVAPSLLAEGERVRAGLDTSLNYGDRPGYQGISIVRGEPRKEGPGAPYAWDSDVSLVGMRDEYLAFTALPWVEVAVTDDLALHAGGGMAWNSMKYDHVGPSSGIPTAATPFEACTGDTVSQSLHAYLHALYTLDMELMRQTVALGADWTRQGRTGRSAFQGVAEPVALDRDTLEETTTETQKFGFFVNDGIELGDLRAVLGVRYDTHRSDKGNTAGTWSPRIGVSYIVTPWLVPFANVLQTSAPNFGNLDADGRELTDHWTATQYEAGLRVAPVSAFWLSLSTFRIEQKNTPLSTSGNANGPFVSEGETRSSGVEVSAVGNLLPNWTLFASWAFINFDDRNSAQKYDRFPPHAVSLYTTYQLEGGPLPGTVLGLGYRYRDGFDQTTRGLYQGAEYRVKAYHVFDASIETPLPASWNLGDASFSLAVKNLLDQRHVESARNMQCFPGDPRTVEIALRWKF
ncbi:MAG: TonB-dependent receptor [Kiritimatiellaeota bacterium]|nr:TonB-dependent receptor [Kiritimatiellota bacterium]